MGRRRGKRGTLPPPHFPTHNKHSNTRQKRNGNDTKGTDNVKGGGTMQGARPNPNTGQHTTHHSRHSTGPQGKRQGGYQHTDGDTDIRRGVSNTTALPHHTTHHPPCHPPSTTRGERTEDTPPHEHHRHTSTTHTPHTRQGTLCDMTAVLAGTATGRVGHEPHHRTGQDSSSTPHRHSTHRGGWTPSTHPLIHSRTVHVHTTDDQ